jgi:hypothetical protein
MFAGVCSDCTVSNSQHSSVQLAVPERAAASNRPQFAIHHRPCICAHCSNSQHYQHHRADHALCKSAAAHSAVVQLAESHIMILDYNKHHNMNLI